MGPCRATNKHRFFSGHNWLEKTIAKMTLVTGTRSKIIRGLDGHPTKAMVFLGGPEHFVEFFRTAPFSPGGSRLVRFREYVRRAAFQPIPRAVARIRGVARLNASSPYRS